MPKKKKKKNSTKINFFYILINDFNQTISEARPTLVLQILIEKINMIREKRHMFCFPHCFDLINCVILAPTSVEIRLETQSLLLIPFGTEWKTFFWGTLLINTTKKKKN